MSEVDPIEAAIAAGKAAYAEAWDTWVPSKECIAAAIRAAEPILKAAGREEAGRQIEEYAESIGWYEGGGVWAQALEIIRGGTL